MEILKIFFIFINVVSINEYILNKRYTKIGINFFIKDDRIYWCFSFSNKKEVSYIDTSFFINYFIEFVVDESALELFVEDSSAFSNESIYSVG